MTVGFDGPGYGPSRDPKGLLRSSSPIVINVTQPPLAGRPSGFRQGDVGHFELSAEVEPRAVTTDGALSIRIELSGAGNLPRTLATPELPGVEWLEPRIVDQLGVQDGKVAGKRSFSYVVRPSQPGHLELGSIELPHWDPGGHRYSVAKANLGSVEVSGAPSSSQAPTPSSEPPTTQWRPRSKLQPVASSSRAWSDSRWFWALLGGGPLMLVAAFTAERTRGQLHSRRALSLQRQRNSPRPHLQAAREAARSGDHAASANATERALFVAIEARFGIKPRAMLRDELRLALEGQGLPASGANACIALLEACDSLRFTGDATSADDLLTSAEAWLARWCEGTNR
jgi:hypothetical protein